jgi:hypothetical protein
MNPSFDPVVFSSNPHAYGNLSGDLPKLSRDSKRGVGKVPICAGCAVSHPVYCRSGQPKPYADCPKLSGKGENND